MPEAKIHVTVQLPRLKNIHFDYDGSILLSREFDGMQVADCQSFGTLRGLANGLLLIHTSQPANMLFLCPHGDVSRSSTSVEIDTARLHDPPLFKYKIRRDLGNLHGTSKIRLEWLFLALLHAQTATLRQDPLLHSTGIRQAMHLLRSPYCTGDLLTSLDPADLETQYIPEIRLLSKIAEISPGRENYHAMESCNFGYQPAICASPVFAFMAKLRIQGICESLRQIGQEGVLQKAIQQANETLLSRTLPLCIRACFRGRQLYPEDECFTVEEELAIFKSGVTIDCIEYDPDPCRFGANLETARSLGVRREHLGDVSNKRACLTELLCKGEELNGVCPNLRLSGGSSSCMKEILEECQKNGDDVEKPIFADIWMNLYMLAKDIIGNQEKAFSDYRCLLVLVGVSYPTFRDHLYQLITVARYSEGFPTPPVHKHYIKPDESDYTPSQVGKVLESNLENFEEREPRRGHYEHDGWCRRKREHARSRAVVESDLAAYIRNAFHKGESVSSGNFCREKISSSAKLARGIQSLFKRWREARELKDFLAIVTARLDTLQTSWISDRLRSCKQLISLPRRVLTTSVQATRANFIMKTSCPIPYYVSSAKSEQFFGVAQTGNVEDAFKLDFPRKEQKQELSPLDLDLSNFIREHPEYKELIDVFVSELQESWKLAGVDDSNDANYFSLFRDASKEELTSQLELYYQRSDSLMSNAWSLIDQELADLSTLKSLVGIWNATTPSSVLQSLFKKTTFPPINVSKQCISFQHLCLAFAVGMKHVQRASRCLRLLEGGSAKYPHLVRDLETTGCEGWTPIEYPEFLGFEIDNDINIRAVQATVAIQILSSAHGNRLLQLNMGQGKTAVIIPLVLCVAARGNCVTRATVLPSLFATNAADWQDKLGGLLDRRVYTFCSRRDLKFGMKQAQMMMGTLKRIKRDRHVIVSIPEHRLSLENKALDLCSSISLHATPGIGIVLLEVVEFLALHGREFLDESDEILSPKYQLIYTLGAARDMDGGMLRWKIHAAVLQSVQRNASELLLQFPKAAETSEGTKPGYCWLRLLESEQTDSAYSWLCKRIVNDIIKERVHQAKSLKLRMNPTELVLWQACVDGKATHLDHLKTLPEKERQASLILRGLLSNEVLKLMLEKRYRVDYGKHPTRKAYKMAVPYRAKDVAADRTEFGHPDMALGLSFASYYQSGLIESELREVFLKLTQLSKASAKAIYSAWAMEVENSDGIAEFEGVNLQDPALFKEKLFPSFFKNIGCIDFYLCKLILPIQAKQFPSKIVATAGDLCRNGTLGTTFQAVTTGFSGTYDLYHALPATVKQINLEELSKTNGVQLGAILRAENDKYRHLSSELNGRNSTEQVLALLHSDELRTDVILDSGALVLHKDNISFSYQWLSLRRDMEACVFFIGDRAFYVTQGSGGKPQPFFGSPYAENMTKCLLYLDDEHTRGSDFAMPLQTKALVTLGKGLTKDKFLQTCMRMRQLQDSQSLSFLAAPEVDMQLRNICGAEQSFESQFIPSIILKWVVANTVIKICDLLPYFVNQSVATITKASALQKYYIDSTTVDANTQGKEAEARAQALASTCTDAEVLSLQHMYGHARSSVALPEIARQQLQPLKGKAKLAILKDLQSRITTLAPTVVRQRSLHDEEQERELENELEEERQVRRPPPAKPVSSMVSPELRMLLSSGSPSNIRRSQVGKLGFSSLGNIFEETSVFAEIGMEMGKGMFCTDDFSSTVLGEGHKDDYIKQIHWIVPLCSSTCDLEDAPLLVISNFEAEAFKHLVGKHIFLFSALQRRGQPDTLVRGTSIPTVKASPSIQVIAGSIYAEGPLLIKIGQFLGLFPQEAAATDEEWDSHFAAGLIERDGFVTQANRPLIDAHLCQSPFTESPVSLCKSLLSNIRHATVELPSSPLGGLLGVSDMDEEADDEY